MRDVNGLEVNVGDTVNAYDGRTGKMFENGVVEVITGNRADVSNSEYDIITVSSEDILFIHS